MNVPQVSHFLLMGTGVLYCFLQTVPRKCSCKCLLVHMGRVPWDVRLGVELLSWRLAHLPPCSGMAVSCLTSNVYCCAALPALTLTGFSKLCLSNGNKMILWLQFTLNFIDC